MSIKYVRLSVGVHGIDATEDGVRFLAGWIKEATMAGLTGHSRELLKFRNEFDTDIEVEIEMTVGEALQSTLYLADKEDVMLDAKRWRWLREQGGWPETENAASGQPAEWFDRLADENLHMQPNT